MRNVGGLWLLQESLRDWAQKGMPYDLPSLLTEAETLPPGGPVIDVDDPAFIAPDGMVDRVVTAAKGSGGPPPSSPAAPTSKPSS